MFIMCLNFKLSINSTFSVRHFNDTLHAYMGFIGLTVLFQFYIFCLQCLFVAQTDDMDTSSCIVTPPQVKYGSLSS